VFVDEGSKAEVIYSFFDNILGSAPDSANTINLDTLVLPCANLNELGTRFMEEEIWKIIRALPADKLSGPDGFMTRFL
jgi:hypothetical protein